MSMFVNSLINRSTEGIPRVQPRISGKYERDTVSSAIPGTETELSQKNVHLPEQRSMDANERREFQPGGPEYFPGDWLSHSNANENSFAKPLSDASYIFPRFIREPNAHEKPTLKRPGPDYKLIHSGKILERAEALQYKSNSQQEKKENAAKESMNKIGEGKTDQASQIELLQKPGKVFRRSPVVPGIIPGNHLHRPEPQLNSGEQAVRPATHSFKEDFKDTRTGSMNESNLSRPVQTINVSIGRVEVRVYQPPPQVQAKPKNEVVTIMGLDQYLDQKKQGIK